MLTYYSVNNEPELECPGEEEKGDERSIRINLLKEKDKYGNVDTAIIVVCSLSMLEAVSNTPFRTSVRNISMRRNGKRVFHILTQIVKGRKRAMEIISKVRSWFSSIASTSGGRSVSVVYVPPVTSCTLSRFRPVERVFLSSDDHRNADAGIAASSLKEEPLSSSMASLRSGGLRKPAARIKERHNSEKGLGAFFLVMCDSSLRVAGDIIARKTLPGTKFDIIYFSTDDISYGTSRFRHLIDTLGGSNIKAIRNVQ
uniref:Wsv322-like protein n=1 Tax=Metapenaeus ensis nimavirus TaxID=2133794 RepID=A0A401IPE1_9VIRU|nr:MAG: wsv322-like protein [Metapenaeus ensis nimavirus]GBG35488.1 wsv322-like protein [Metapenaeus ensis nimavirus]